MRSPLKGPACMRLQGASLGCREFSLGVQKGCRTCAHASKCSTHVVGTLTDSREFFKGNIGPF